MEGGHTDISGRIENLLSRGRRDVEVELPRLTVILDRLGPNVNILCPYGVDLVKAVRDDIDDTVDIPLESSDGEVTPIAADLEDAIADEDHEEFETGRKCSRYEPCFEFEGKQVYKSRFLKEAFTQFRNPNSTDRLKRVANMPRYAIKQDQCPAYPDIVTEDSPFEDGSLAMNSPISTLIRCENHLFLAVGEIIDMLYQGRHCQQLSPILLADPTTFVSYQLLFLVPTTSEDGSVASHDWKWTYLRGPSYHRVPGRLIHPVNPDISTSQPGKPFYVFDSATLRALGMSMLDDLLPEDGQSLPEITPSVHFPYRHLGKACFICEHDGKEREVIDAAVRMCTHCQPCVPLDKSTPRVLEHVGCSHHVRQRYRQ